MARSAVTVRDLRVVRGGAVALDGVSLEVPAGKITGLLGPSGSGKTTLIRSILGVQVLAGGTVSVLGRPAGSRELRRRVGYVTQAPSVYPDLTVEENLRYFARVLGVRGDGAADVDAVTTTVGLEAQRRRLVGALSGGQRSRVSLAAALLGRPDLLVLDEPTVGLDPAIRESLWGTFTDVADGGTTILVSSHVMDEAQRCDTLVLLREGKVLTDGPLSALLARTGTTTADAAFLALVTAPGGRP
ncbi:ABC transporter ATP-binding protein [Georgenia sp. MJ206]|uniref:ABC transporter ATP-binding protein n=1 Tax=Georgenia wangjunii TaxID=3117730 RepID=UPI002F26870B